MARFEVVESTLRQLVERFSRVTRPPIVHRRPRDNQAPSVAGCSSGECRQQSLQMRPHAVTSASVGSAAARKAGGTTQEIVFVRKAGGHEGE
jgi:hypothetical protein